MPELFIHILWRQNLEQGRVEVVGYHSDHGCWPHEEESSHSNLWGSQDDPDRDIIKTIPIIFLK